MKLKSLIKLLPVVIITAMSTALWAQPQNLGDVPNKRLLRETLLRMKQQTSLPGLKRYQDRQIINELKYRLGDDGGNSAEAKMNFTCLGKNLTINFINEYGQSSQKRVDLSYDQNCQTQLNLLNRKLSNVNEPSFFALCTRFDIARYYEVTTESLRETHSGYVRPYANCLSEAQRVTRGGKRW